MRDTQLSLAAGVPILADMPFDGLPIAIIDMRSAAESGDFSGERFEAGFQAADARRRRAPASPLRQPRLADPPAGASSYWNLRD